MTRLGRPTYARMLALGKEHSDDPTTVPLPDSVKPMVEPEKLENSATLHGTTVPHLFVSTKMSEKLAGTEIHAKIAERSENNAKTVNADNKIPGCMGMVDGLPAGDLIQSAFEFELTSEDGSEAWVVTSRVNRLRSGPLHLPLVGIAQVLTNIAAESSLAVQCVPLLPALKTGQTMNTLQKYYESTEGASFLDGTEVKLYIVKPGAPVATATAGPIDL